MSKSPADVFVIEWMRQLEADELARPCRLAPVTVAAADGAHVFLAVDIEGQRCRGMVIGRELFLTLPGDAGGQLGAAVIATESGQADAETARWWLAKRRGGGVLSLHHALAGLSEAGCRALAHTFGLPVLPLIPRARHSTLKPARFFYCSPAFAALRGWAALRAPGTLPAPQDDDPLGDWAAAALRPGA